MAISRLSSTCPSTKLRKGHSGGVRLMFDSLLSSFTLIFLFQALLVALISTALAGFQFFFYETKNKITLINNTYNIFQWKDQKIHIVVRVYLRISTIFIGLVSLVFSFLLLNIKIKNMSHDTKCAP